jgi:hypothetical protein
MDGGFFQWTVMVLQFGSSASGDATLKPFVHFLWEQQSKYRLLRAASLLSHWGRVVYSSDKGMGLTFGDIEQEQVERLEAWLGPLRERDWLVQNRRKTQRVLMRVPVRISGQNAVGSQFEEETHALAVNANGALLLSVPVRKGQVLHLLNVAMGNKAECVVAHLGPRQGDLLVVGIAFRLEPAYRTGRILRIVLAMGRDRRVCIGIRRPLLGDVFLAAAFFFGLRSFAEQSPQDRQ